MVFRLDQDDTLGNIKMIPMGILKEFNYKSPEAHAILNSATLLVQTVRAPVCNWGLAFSSSDSRTDILLPLDKSRRYLEHYQQSRSEAQLHLCAVGIMLDTGSVIVVS